MRSAITFIVEKANHRFVARSESSAELTYRETEGEAVEAAVRMLRNLGYSGEHMTERRSDGSILVWLYNIHGQSPALQ